MPTPLERREVLPAHPLPAGLAAPAAWQLRVDGLVAQPLVLSLSEVDALEAQAHAADFVCEEGWVVPAQRWEGVAIAAVLARAGVQPAARFLKVHAGDFTVLLPLEEALAGGALLRLVAPGRACWYSVKWVDRLELVAEDTATTGEGRARLQR